MTLGSGGSIAAVRDYYPFGGLIREYANGVTDRFKFTEKERDVETNYDYFGARYYDSELGRWMAVDPLAVKYFGLSPYNYCLNNPLLFMDPTGKYIVGSDGKPVTIVFNDDGTLEFSDNATVDIRIIALGLNRTAKGIAALKAFKSSDIKVNFILFPKLIVDENGGITLGETIQGNMDSKNNYGRFQREDGSYYGINEATVTIYDKAIFEACKIDSRYRQYRGKNWLDGIGAVSGHEKVHAVNKNEINKDIDYELQNPGYVRPDREVKAEEYEKAILDQINTR